MPNQVQLGHTFTAVEIKSSMKKKPVHEGRVADWQFGRTVPTLYLGEARLRENSVGQGSPNNVICLVAKVTDG